MKAHLDTSGIKKLKSQLQTLKSKEVDFGYMGDEGIHSQANIPYAELAYMLEEGNDKIPSRPAMKDTVSKLRTSKTEFESSMSPLFRDFVLLKDKGGNRLLNTAGVYLMERYQYTMEFWFISGSKHRTNSPITASLKGHNRPYEDTGELIRNATFRVR